MGRFRRSGAGPPVLDNEETTPERTLKMRKMLCKGLHNPEKVAQNEWRGKAK